MFETSKAQLKLQNCFSIKPTFMKNHQLEEGGANYIFLKYIMNQTLCYQDIDTDIESVMYLKPNLVDFLVLQTLF